MTQFAVNFWHLKNLPSFKNCGRPVQREQDFGTGTENLTCQLGRSQRIVSETRGSACNKSRLCTVRTFVISTSARSGRERQPAVFVPFLPYQLSLDSRTISQDMIVTSQDSDFRFPHFITTLATESGISHAIAQTSTLVALFSNYPAPPSLYFGYRSLQKDEWRFNEVHQVSIFRPTFLLGFLFIILFSFNRYISGVNCTRHRPVIFNGQV